MSQVYSLPPSIFAQTSVPAPDVADTFTMPYPKADNLWYARKNGGAEYLINNNPASGAVGCIQLSNGNGLNDSDAGFTWDKTKQNLLAGSGNSITNSVFSATIGQDNNISGLRDFNYVIGNLHTISAGGWNVIAGGDTNIIEDEDGDTGTVNNNGIIAGEFNIIRRKAGGGGVYNTFATGFYNTIETTVFTPFASAMGTRLSVTNTLAMAFGFHATAAGWGAVAWGDDVDTNDPVLLSGAQPVLASGRHSFNFSGNSLAQTASHGSLGDYSVILGGIDHNIPSTSPRSAIIGGSTIKARASDPDQVYVPSINIVTTPTLDNTLTQILGRDSTTGLVKYTTISSIVGSYMPLSGGTFTGAVTMNADAVSSLQPVTLQQLNAALVGLWDDRGTYNASSNLFPSTGGSGTAGAILKGDIWTVSVAGTLGGTPVQSGDTVRALTDSPGQTAGNWALGEHDLGYTPLTNVLTSGNIFVGNASNVATSVTMSGDATMANTGAITIANNAVTYAKIQQASAGLTLLGRSSNSAGNYAEITAASDNQILRRSGTSIGFGSIDLSQSNTVGSSILGGANGGTGVNNGSSTITVANNFTTSGNFALTLTTTATTNATLPSGTVTLQDLSTAQTITVLKTHQLTTEQLRLGYDSSNYCTFTVGSTGSITLDLVGTSPTFTFSKSTFVNSVFATNSTITSANFGVGGSNGGNNSTNANIQLLSSTTLNYRVIERGSGSVSPAANTSMANHIIGTQTATIAATGTHAIFAQMALKALSITTGAGTLTNSATLYIENAATNATNNYAIWVDDGETRFDGNVALFGAGSYGGGVGVEFRANATTVPTTNPSGGSVVYTEAGALKARGSSGTVTTIAPADPHCEVCGSDFVVEFENAKYGYYCMCMKCLGDHIGNKPFINRQKGKWNIHT